MHFEYELSREEFNELILVHASGPAMSPAGKGIRPWIAYSVIAICMVIALIVLTYGRVRTDGWMQLLEAAAKSEWIIPWYVAMLMRCIPGLYGRGLHAVRTAWIASSVVLLISAFFVLLGEIYSPELSPLRRYGAERLLPWLVNGVTLWSFFRLAWPMKRFEAQFKSSWFFERRFTVALLDDALVSSTDQFLTSFAWSGLESLRASGLLLNIFDVKRNLVIVIPNRAIGDAAEVRRVREIIESRLSKRERGFAVTAVIDDHSPAPPYK
jgi:hypothetical protein